MSEEDKQSLKILKIVLLVLFVIFIFLIVQWLYRDSIGNPFDFNNLKDDESKRSALGALGDYFGGLLNPILAFFSFIALLWTLKLNQEELAETRKELARSAKAHEDSKKVMDEQLKTQSLQQFDSLFSTLISELSKKIDHLYPSNVKELNVKVFKKYESNKNKRQLIIDDHNFSVFFIFLYQLLKLIDTSLTEKITQKKYANIVRSLIPDEILQLLMMNCYLDTKEHNFDKYKKLLEDFEFFEHISLYDNKNLLKTSLLLSVATHYQSKAFGQNKAYTEYKTNIIFRELNKNNNFIEIIKSVADRTVELDEEEIFEPDQSIPDRSKKIIKRSLRLHDGENVLELSCIWSTDTKSYTVMKLQNNIIEKISIGADAIIFFSRYYEKGVSVKLIEDNSGNCVLDSSSVIKNK